MHLEPLRAVLEAVAIRDVVNDQRAHCIPVVGGRHGAVPLLAGGVPHLCLDGLAIVLNLPRRKLDADGALRVRLELVFREAAQQACLAHV